MATDFVLSDYPPVDDNALYYMRRNNRLVRYGAIFYGIISLCQEEIYDKYWNLISYVPNPRVHWVLKGDSTNMFTKMELDSI